MKPTSIITVICGILALTIFATIVPGRLWAAGAPVTNLQETIFNEAIVADNLWLYCEVMVGKNTGDAGQFGLDMTLTIERDSGLNRDSAEQFGLECPYCGVFSHMAPQSVPSFDSLQQEKPKYIGLVYQCDACHAPIFLRFSVKQYTESGVELNRNFLELERPKERFAFSYLPKDTDTLFREALSCYSSHNFNAFASMCRRAASSAFLALGENGKMLAFDEVLAAQKIAEIDVVSFGPVKVVLFESNEDLPLLNRAQAGMLLEVMKDMLYQCFVRRGKLTQAIKVRRFFVEEGASA